MVVGVGVDVFDVSRMRRALEEDPGLPSAVFTPREVAECARARDPARQYAARFAAKEATLKGLGLRPCDTGVFRDIEVCVTGRAAAVVLQGRLRAALDTAPRLDPHVSLAHTGDHVIATVIVERFVRPA
jgi:holo-[acyl-carrier protein] synthase